MLPVLPRFSGTQTTLGTPCTRHHGRSGVEACQTERELSARPLLPKQLDDLLRGRAIGAAGITLDLDGHTLSSVDGQGLGVDNSGGFDSVTIRNATFAANSVRSAARSALSERRGRQKTAQTKR